MRTWRTLQRALLLAVALVALAWAICGCGAVPLPSGDAGEDTYGLIQLQAKYLPGSVPADELEAADDAIEVWRTSSDPAAKAGALRELLRIKAAYCPFREAGCAAHGAVLAGGE